MLLTSCKPSLRQAITEEPGLDLISWTKAGHCEGLPLQ